MINFIAVLSILPIFLILIDTVLRFTFIISSKTKIEKNGTSKGSINKLAFVIAAKNEEAIIGNTIEQIKGKYAPNEDTIFVVADHCEDSTIQKVEKLGVVVFNRREGIPGKSGALAWFAIVAKDLLLQHDAVIILDADSLLDDNFISTIRSIIPKEFTVYQSSIQPIFHNSTLASLAAFSELLSQFIDDTARKNLGWPIPLRGAGMIFQPRIFVDISAKIDNTQADDIEYTIQLINQDIPTKYIPQAIIYDPKPETVKGLGLQRGRWLFGQRQILQKYRTELINVAKKGIYGWSLIHGVLLKPKTLFLSLKLLVLLYFELLIFAGFNQQIGELLITLILFSFCIDVLYYVYGLFLIPKPGRFIGALLRSPLYITVWLIGLTFSFKAKHQWLRSRDD